MSAAFSQPKKSPLRKVLWTLGGLAVLGVLFTFLNLAITTCQDGLRRIDIEAMAIPGTLAQYQDEFGAFPAGDTRAV